MLTVIRALDLQSGGTRFKSSSIPLDGFVLVVTDFVYSQLVCILPAEIRNISTAMLTTLTLKLSDVFIYSLYCAICFIL